MSEEKIPDMLIGNDDKVAPAKTKLIHFYRPIYKHKPTGVCEIGAWMSIKNAPLMQIEKIKDEWEVIDWQYKALDVLDK